VGERKSRTGYFKQSRIPPAEIEKGKEKRGEPSPAKTLKGGKKGGKGWKKVSDPMGKEKGRKKKRREENREINVSRI